ncbi:MAG: LysR family transcriptional regulator, partial [Myxococcales bacterium]|nr:LysR family transcriptional regulator [Myxococcales bacterium]
RCRRRPDTHMFQWSDVHLFLSVASRGSFTAAAHELSLDQTTIGRRIASLEAALGTKLFHRGRSGLSLTTAGEEVLIAAREMEHAANALDRRVSGRDRAAEGSVRLTTVDTFGSRFLAPRLPELQRRYPKIALTIVTSPHVLSLTQRQADLAVRLWKPTQPGLVARKIGEYAYALYASPKYVADHPQPLSDSTAHDFLGFDTELAAIPEALWIAERARDRFAFRTNSFAMLEQAALAGAGIAVLPCYLAEGRADLARVGGRETVVNVRPLWLVVHRELQAQARIRAVTQFIAHEVGGAKEALLGRATGRSRSSHKEKAT